MSGGSGRTRSRRGFLQLLCGSLVAASDRGVAGSLRLATQRAGGGPGLFTDVTAAAGLSRALNVSGSPTDKQFLLEEMGGGVALFDYDNDGWLDIFLVNGSSFDATVRDRKPTSYLFHNNRDGTFTDVTQKAGLTHSGWGQGCCVGDFDNDGFDDLFVSYWGRNVLYRNNGNGTFTDVTDRAGVAGPEQQWGAGCCFLDFDRDGRLDLFVASYVAFDPGKAPRPGDNAYCRYNDIPVPCGPLGYAGGTNLLYRNRGDGTFEDVSEASGIARPRGSSTMVFVGSNWRPTGSYGMGAAAADFDNDGWPDIYVACDTAPSQLYRNNHDGTFRETAATAGCAFDEAGAALAGMGVGVGDYDGDGWLDIVRTNFSEQVTTLYRNYGAGAFEVASLRAGLGVNRKYVGFGVNFFDFDNDGWKDIFIANGHVYSQLEGRKLHLTYRQPNLLYRNTGSGRFVDVSASAGTGVTSPNLGRGSAVGDLDNDGGVDIVINNLDGPPTAVAKRWRERAELDPDQVCRHQIESLRDRNAGQGHRGRANANRRGDERFELLLAQRFPPAFRPGARGDGGAGRARVAVGPEGKRSRPPRQSPHRRRGVEGDREPAAIRAKGSLMKAILSLPLLGLALAALLSDVQFTDITKASGIAFAHANSATPSKYLVETMGGGVALFDYDNDGRLDVFFTNGARIEEPMPRDKRPDKSDPAYWNRLYRQRADGAFEDVTEKAGVSGRPQNQYGMGAAVGDYDNDGFEDLYVTNYGANTLYRNSGDGTFADVTARAGVAAGGWSTSAGFVDYDNDGHLDLFVTRYLDWSFQQNRYCGEKKPGYRAYCHPDNFEAIANVLFRNNGDGTFADVSLKAGITGAPGKGLGLAFADYDDDGWIDVYVANDSFPSFLFRNGKGVFTEEGLLAGVALNEDGKTFAGMGVDFSDYDNDGRPDVFVTDLSNERYRLFRHNGDGSFRDATNASGIGGGDARLLGLEHAVRRLRQRRVEGHLRRAGTRDGHDREDVAQPALPAAAVAVAQRVGALRPRPRRRRVQAGPGGPRRRVRRSRQRRRRRRRRQQRRAAGDRPPQRRRQPPKLARDSRRRAKIRLRAKRFGGNSPKPWRRRVES